MAGRTVGKGRGAVYVGGQIYAEGATIPKDVEVGDHVFTDVDDVEGNVSVSIMQPQTAESQAAAAAADGGGDGPADGTVDEVLTRVGDDPAAAQAALDAEAAKGEKSRSTLVEKLQAVVDAGSGS